MKPCRKNRKLIVWSVIGALDQTQAAELKEHLRHCAVCTRYRAEIEKVQQKVAGLELSVETAEVVNPNRQSIPSPRPGSFARAMRTRSTSGLLTDGLKNLAMSWRVAVPALCVVALALFLFSVLWPPPLKPSTVPALAEVPPASIPSVNLAPTLANYRAVANESLDELDDLLMRQSRRPIPAPPAYTAGTLALLRLSD